MNNGDSRQRGFEVEAETLAFHKMSLTGGIFYVHHDRPEGEDMPEDQYSIGLGLRYRDGDDLSANLFGQYVWWNTIAENDASYKDFIWDFTVTRRVWRRDPVGADLFLSVHNLFNGSQYVLGYRPNPDRWAEAGIRLLF